MLREQYHVKEASVRQQIPSYFALKTARDHNKLPLFAALQVAGVQTGLVPTRLLDGETYGCIVRIVADFMSN